MWRYAGGRTPCVFWTVSFVAAPQFAHACLGRTAEVWLWRIPRPLLVFSHLAPCCHADGTRQTAVPRPAVLVVVHLVRCGVVWCGGVPLWGQGLESKVINSVEEILLLKDEGKRLRHVGKTAMNATSSRSHSIFTVTVESCEVREDGKNHIRVRRRSLTPSLETAFADTACPGWEEKPLLFPHLPPPPPPANSTLPAATVRTPSRPAFLTLGVG
jgi:hypothetical protein